MKKFKILTIFGSFLVGTPAIIAIIVVFSSIKNYNRHELEGLYRIPKPKTTPDTIVVEKIVEKIKVDTFYVKVTPPPSKQSVTPPDTL